MTTLNIKTLTNNKGETLVEIIIGLLLFAIMMLTIVTIIDMAGLMNSRALAIADDLQTDLNQIVVSNSAGADNKKFCFEFIGGTSLFEDVTVDVRLSEDDEYIIFE